MDAMPEMSRFLASGAYLCFSVRDLVSEDNSRMCCVRVRIVPYTTCGKRPRRTLKMGMGCWNVLMKRCGDIGVFIACPRMLGFSWIETLYNKYQYLIN